MSDVLTDTEHSFEPKPSNYLPDEAVLNKLEKLVTEKKAAQLEKERLASMPRKPFIREEPRVGRNDPCPCGSGKKYKKCCMSKDAA